MPPDAVLGGDEAEDRGVDPAEARGVASAGEGEGGVERLLDLLDAADAGVDARAALEREHRAEGRAVVGAVEADAERGGGRGEGPRGGVEEEVAMGVGAAEVGREEGGEAAVGGCVGEAELDLGLHGDGAA